MSFLPMQVFPLGNLDSPCQTFTERVELSDVSMTSSAGDIPQFTIGDRLRKARKHAGLDIDQMAELLGFSDKTVRNYENEATPIKRASISAWALATGVPFEWLLTGEVQRPDDPNGPTEQDDRQSGCKLYRLPTAA